MLLSLMYEMGKAGLESFPTNKGFIQIFYFYL